MTLFLALLVTTPVASADWPAGTVLDPAITVDLTEPGLDAMANVVPALVPERIELDDMYSEGAVYRMNITNLWVGMQVIDADMAPGNDVLALDTSLMVWLADSSDPFHIDVDAYTFWWWDLATCDAWSDPFQVWVEADISLRVIDNGIDPPWLDATIGGVVWSWDLENEDIELDCWVGTLDDILGWVGLSPVDMAISSAEEELDAAIDDMIVDIEAMLEEAFASAIVDQTMELSGAELGIHVHPSEVLIRPEGVRIELAGSVQAPPAPCIQEYDIVQSKETPGEPPGLGQAPPSVPSPHHLGVFVDDDFLNQALFATWYGGLLCTDLSEEDGLPLNTALLGALSPTYAQVFPETEPLQIVTRPARPPLASPSGDFDVNLEVELLGVDLMTELEHRRANLLGADLAVSTGADLRLDGATGELDVLVALSAEDIDTTIRFNEIAPGEDEAIAQGFTSLFDAVVGPLLGPMLEDLSFALPAFEGVGLTSMAVAPAGSSEDHLGIFGEVGPVTYGADGSGCGGCGGEGGEEGCDSGCASGAPAAGWVALVGLLGALLRRRRR